eukprot:TRINITY_DN108639_c0_g1_i1.p1 TRINITY_DN108639_c0_g1~~TRINITY_DN108639_c0_g1_i1.p1  ORF type:complete len:465 (-),score=73.30 TRINITY_DN108639_c0_g1_i1:180-1574(-)
MLKSSKAAVAGSRQVCCVVRHAERADAPYALYEGAAWTRSSDCQRWRFDPPLSDDGELGALETAAVVKGFVEKAGSSIDIVVTSPYLRCVQTAATICKALGEETRLMIDSSVGEIFGPSIFGETEPQNNHLRPPSDLFQECERRGVKKYCPRQLGEAPSWPEDVHDGRQRFAESFLKYVERSCCSSNNFMVVTHGDLVGATAALLPKVDSNVLQVEPGGGILASRKLKGRPQTSFSSQTLDVAPYGVEAATPDSFSTDELLGGWSTHSFGIKFAQRRTKRPGGLLKTMIRSMQNFSRKSKLPQDRVQSLLRALSGDELGTVSCSQGAEETERACAVEHQLGQGNTPDLLNSRPSSSASHAGNGENAEQRVRTITTELFCKHMWSTQELHQHRRHSDLETPKSPGPSHFGSILPQPLLSVPGIIEPEPGELSAPTRDVSFESVSSSSLWQRRQQNKNRPSCWSAT